MTIVHDPVIGRFRPSELEKHLASRYAPGVSDGLGDRLLMFEDSNSPSWELLRFRPELVAVPGFEAALRERVDLLAQFHHGSFPAVRAVEFLGSSDEVALVSTCAPGRRLAEALGRARGAAFAVRLIRQLTPALAALQQQGALVAHGALAIDRVAVTPDGRFMILDYVLGSALQRLEWPADRLWSELGIVVPATDGTAKLDCRSDVIQLALVALALMVGRRVDPDEYPDKIDELLNRVAETTGRRSPDLFPSLRVWLERALHLHGVGFSSARDAHDALGELRDDDASRGAGDAAVLNERRLEDSWQALTQPGSADGSLARILSMPVEPPPVMVEDRPSSDELVHAAVQPDAASPVSSDTEPNLKTISTETAARVDRIDDIGPRHASPARRAGALTERGIPKPPWWGRIAEPNRWITAAVAVVVIAEAILIGRLLYTRSTAASPLVVVESSEPGADVLVDGQPIGVTPLTLRVAMQTGSIRIVGHERGTAGLPRKDGAGATGGAFGPGSTTEDPRAVDAPGLAAGAQKTGRLRLSSPIELQVLDGDKLVGSSSDGTIVASAGPHEFEFVNTALAYRSRQVVNVKAGELVTVSVSPPNGRLSINASPWAEVWIDGNPVGETPLANLPVAVGEHRIVFRHPELGERRETAAVRSDGLTRVTVDLTR